MVESFEQALARIANSVVASDKAESFIGCIYGPSGTGKSVLAAMIARALAKLNDGDIIIDFDTSQGYVSWQNIPGLTHPNLKPIPFTTYDDIRKVILGIKKGIPPFDRVRVIILDEYSKMQEINVLRVHEAREKGQFAAARNAAPSQSLVPEGIDYQIDLAMFRKMNSELSELRNVHIISVAHQEDKKDRQGNVISVFPSFGPKVARNVKEAAHLTAHITAKITKDPKNPAVSRIERTAQVHPSLMVDAKCRLNISSTSVPADSLPVLIRDWFFNGGPVADAEDVARAEIHTQEELNERTKDLSPEDIKGLVEDVPSLDGLDELFSSSSS